MTRWRYAAATDTGLVRETNQDAIFVGDDLALVADGMGGHAAGEVASELTTQLVSEEFRDRPTIEGLYRAIEAANRAILADGRENPEHFGMGTTVIAVGLTHDEQGVVSPTLFHVGDSRAYQLRDGALRQLSDDHSVAEEWVRMGRLTPDEASVHPRRHQLTRALGVDEMVDIDVMSLNVLPGDRVLLCSDGLSNEVSNELLAHLASPPISLEDSVEQLVAAARGAGGRDNISVVLLEFDEVTPATTPIRKTIGSTPPPVAQSARTPTIRSSRRPRRLTWRVWAGVFVCALVAGGFVMVMHWYAYSTYYLANDAGKIAVYQGQPHGVLWFKPVKVVDTTNLVAQLRPADRTALAATIGEPTLESALKYANALHNSWLLGQPVMSISSTTTTTKG